jgi:RNA polymerase sigma-70 factor (ECF subfamily)
MSAQVREHRISATGTDRLRQTDGVVAQLYDSFSSRIYFVALRELRSRAAAEDVCNETLVRVMQALREGRVTSQDAVPGFVATTARNVMHEFRRKDDRADPIGDRDFAAPSCNTMVDESVRRVMQRVLELLKPREREVLRLYFYEELPKEEISRRLGVDPERVRLIKSRALKSFRDLYTRLVR